MSPTNILFNDVWKKLSDTMEQMFQFRSMTQPTYMIYYNTVSRYFNSPEYNENLLQASLSKPKPIKQSDKKDNETNKKDNEENNEEVDTNIPGGELYFNLKNFLRTNLEIIAAGGNNLQGEDFLRFYAKTWEKYQFLSQVINGIFGAMNSGWIRRQRESGVKGVHDVYTMAMHIWQDIFFKESNRSLSQTCFKLIKDDRDGKTIDLLLIKQVAQSYVSAGFTEAERKNKSSHRLFPTLTTYSDYFEKQFLEETEQFYKLEAQNYYANHAPIEYLRKIHQRLKEEEHRVINYLHPTTLDKLKPKLEEILIKDHFDVIYTTSKDLLYNERIEDLRVIFELVNRIPKANEPIQKDLETFVYETGMDAMNRESATAKNDPKIYVETIIKVYLRFFEIVKQAFCCEQGYMVAIDKAFGKLVNDNAVTREAKRSTKSPELLARYCDILLRKGNKAEESDVETKIDQIMIVFNYVEDKDVFQKFYGKLLAKRLVGQLSASDDYEESMISKLKAACGFEYASKLQRMFQDIRLSTTLTEEYKTDCQQKGLNETIDFSATVLTSNSWPFTAPLPFNLSTELKRVLDSFTYFYSKKFTGRKLECLYQHSKGELQTLYTKPKYTVQVSTYQMAILLLFNEYEKLTVERMLDITHIEPELFVQVLLILLKSTILTCEQISTDELTEDYQESGIKMEFTIKVNDTFKSKRMRFNINQQLKSVEQKDSETVNQSIDEDRKILIQAAVVRIMKARKELKHAMLIQEVIPQLTSRFKPQIPMIKKCIDILIEKEYLERDTKERDLFRYLA